MPADLVWPHHTLRPRDMQWSPSSSAYQGGRPFSGGAPQAVSFSGGGLWKARLIGVRLRTREQVNTWHALEALLSGCTTTIVIPRCDRHHGPLLPPTVPRGPGVPHSDGTSFSDDTLYAGALVDAYLVGDAALRATTIRMHISGGSLIGGEHFSIDHGGALSWRLYRIARILGEVGGVSTVEIRPPLRGPVEDGAPIEFRLPRCLMRLADPDGMEVTVEMGRRASPTVEFRETF